MALRFIAVDPESGDDNSPTLWVEETTGDLVIQGWAADADLLRQVSASPAPRHRPGVPEGEAVVRIPASMIAALRKADDGAEEGLD